MVMIPKLLPLPPINRKNKMREIRPTEKPFFLNGAIPLLCTWPWNERMVIHSRFVAWTSQLQGQFGRI